MKIITMTREIGKNELMEASAGKNLFNKVFNIVGGALSNDVIEGIAGAVVAGPGICTSCIS